METFASVVIMLAVLVGLLYAFAPRGARASMRGLGRGAHRAARGALATRRRVAATVTVLSAVAALVHPGFWVGVAAVVAALLWRVAGDRRFTLDEAAAVSLLAAASAPVLLLLREQGVVEAASIDSILGRVAAVSVLVAAAASALPGARRGGAHAPSASDAHVVLGVTRADFEAAKVRVAHGRDGRVRISPVPPSARLRTDVEARVSAVWPGWVVASLSAAELVLEREQLDAVERRQHLEASGGLLVGPVVTDDAICDVDLDVRGTWQF